MKYFNSFPKVYIKDSKGNFLTATNIMVRSEIIPSLLKNPMLFYQYDIQEGDTPDSVAHKYYGDPYRYWLIFFANQMIDPQWDWPLTSREFNDYIIQKYAAYAYEVDLALVMAYAQETTYGYTKTITTIDSSTGTTTTNTYVIDHPTYLSTFENTTTQYFPDGYSVTQTITKNTLSLYDHEIEVNEAKRQIQLINSSYVGQIESQFKTLMSA
jgi:hypothetical protein